MPTRKQKTFEVMVRVVLDTSLTIQADTFEQALERGRTYGVRDVVDFNTVFNDGSVEVTGVFA